MRGDIVARLPKDADKILRFSWTESARVGNLGDTCERCENPAALVMRGETDSMGWEPVVLCEACYKKLQAEERNHDEALDVEDRSPPPGMKFLVAEMTNIDSHLSWCLTFNSYRDAVAFLRRIEKKAARYGGLYPNKGVQTVLHDRIEISPNLAKEIRDHLKED